MNPSDRLFRAIHGPTAYRCGRALAAELRAVLGPKRVTDIGWNNGPRRGCLSAELPHAGDAERVMVIGGRLARALDVASVQIFGTSYGVRVELPLPEHMWTKPEGQDVRTAFGGMCIGLGLNARGRLVWVDLARDASPHLGIFSVTGAGKTTVLRSILWQLAIQQTPAELALILVDAKRDGLAPLENCPHLIHPLLTDPVEAGAVLTALAKSLDTAPENPPRRTLVVIDELADILDATGGPDGAPGQAVRRLLTFGRSRGIRAIICTQHPLAETIGRRAIASVGTRLVGSVADAPASRLCTGIEGRAGSIAQRLAGDGDFVLCQGGAVVDRLQAAMVTDEEWRMLPSGGPSGGLDVTPATVPIRGVHPTQAPTEVAPDEVVAVLRSWQDTGREPGVKAVERIVRGVSGACGVRRAERVKDAAVRTRQGLVDAGLLIGGGDGR